MKTAHAITHLCELTTEQLHHLMKTIDVDIRTAECSGAEIVAEVQMVFFRKLYCKESLYLGGTDS